MNDHHTAHLHTEPHHLEITTPEGVPLAFRVASAGDRLGAFAIDCLAMTAAATVCVVIGVLAFSSEAGVLSSLITIATFVVFAFYFTIFEIRWHGATPGKRMIGIRVIDADGQPLSSQAIFTRNLTRKVELVIPLAILTSPGSFWPGAPAWAVFCSLGWAIALLLLPILNRRRQRAGDFIANTIVVRPPRASLLRDLTSRNRAESNEAPQYRYELTPEELDLYGIFELQTLERVLRNRDTPQSTLDAIVDKVRTKIGWDDRDVHSRTFLHDFYGQLRGHLERKLLFGQRQERKKAGTLRDRLAPPLVIEDEPPEDDPPA